MAEEQPNMVNGMSPDAVNQVADKTTQPVSRNDLVFGKDPEEAVKRSERMKKRGTPEGWPDPEKSPADKAVETWNQEKEAEFAAKEKERNDKRTSLIEQRDKAESDYRSTIIDINSNKNLNDTEKNDERIAAEQKKNNAVGEANKDIAALDAEKPKTALDGLTPEQREEYETKRQQRELIDQNLRYQEARLAKGMAEFQAIMADQSTDLVAKAAKLRELQQIYTAVGELRGVVADLDEMQLAMLDKSGMMKEGLNDEIVELRKQKTHEAETAKNKREAHLVGSENEDLLSRKEFKDLTQDERRNRSEATKAMADNLIAQLEGVRGGKKLTDEEKKAYMEAWGLTTTKIEGVDYQIARKGSVLETVLIVEGRKQDAQAAYDANMDAVGKDEPCQEKAFEAANLLVQAQAAEVITHAMILETVSQENAKKAIKAAEAMGALDKADRLKLILQQSKEIVAKAKETVGAKMGEFWDLIKDPAKKVGKALLIAIAISLLLALVAAGAAMSALGGGGR